MSTRPPPPLYKHRQMYECWAMNQADRQSWTYTNSGTLQLSAAPTLCLSVGPDVDETYGFPKAELALCDDTVKSQLFSYDQTTGWLENQGAFPLLSVTPPPPSFRNAHSPRCGHVPGCVQPQHCRGCHGRFLRLHKRFVEPGVGDGKQHRRLVSAECRRDRVLPHWLLRRAFQRAQSGVQLKTGPSGRAAGRRD
mmetsp:Transcript_67499/g.186242  ORF Transcript_67499/g.186242 Transcript_67499/m.186242 type:complete len:194 (+) Transcript_67499:3223-3804(+)